MKRIAFFRGLTLPIITLPLNNSILFGVYSYSLNHLNKNKKNEEADLEAIYISGVIGNFICFKKLIYLFF